MHAAEVFPRRQIVFVFLLYLVVVILCVEGGGEGGPEMCEWAFSSRRVAGNSYLGKLLLSSWGSGFYRLCLRIIAFILGIVCLSALAG